MSYHGGLCDSIDETLKPTETLRMKLILHRGLSFCDVSAVHDTVQGNPSSSEQNLGSSRWLYSKHKFKTQVETILKDWGSRLEEVILLDEFADRLSGLRMGGSVAAVFPAGLEKLTQKIHQTPIHSESMIFTAPLKWSDEWVQNTLAAIQKDTVKRIAWQVEVPKDVLRQFSEAGFENFVIENLHSDIILNWRRNLLNASCSGPILELTEEVQSLLNQLEIKASLKWVDEDLVPRTEVKNRYGLTSAWTHLIAKWAEQKLEQPSDVFVMDWDGCFHIGSKGHQRWTPWGHISTQEAIPSVNLLRIQPTTTLEKNDFGQWSWQGKADFFEPGPVFLGRGLKPTVLDLACDRIALQNFFEVKSDFEEKTLRLMASLGGFKSADQARSFKNEIAHSAIQAWTQNMLELSETENWLVVGPLATLIQTELSGLKGVKANLLSDMPSLAELYPYLVHK